MARQIGGPQSAVPTLERVWACRTLPTIEAPAITGKPLCRGRPARWPDLSECEIPYQARPGRALRLWSRLHPAIAQDRLDRLAVVEGLLTLTDDRLRLLAVSELAEMAYWEAVVSHLAAVSEDERNALIFVHVSFEDVALRDAQIGFDLSVKGAMTFFSWPSRGVPRRYAADAATIEASEGMIADFMTAFAERSGAKAVHIIAHSRVIAACCAQSTGLRRRHRGAP